MGQITKTPIVQAMDELVYTDADEVKAVNTKQLKRVLHLKAIDMAKEALAARLGRPSVAKQGRLVRATGSQNNFGYT